MRGLPPFPTDVLELRATIALAGSEVEIVQHFFAQGSIAWGPDEFSQMNSGWSAFCEANLLDLMPSDSSFKTLRLFRYGVVPYRYVNDLAANNGAGAASAPLNAALCLTWHTTFRGIVSRAHNRLPIPSDVIDSGRRRVDQVFWSFAQLRAALYIKNFNEIVVAGFSPPELVVVSRSAGGLPRAASTFSPVVSGEPSRNVATLAVRTRLGR